MCSWMISTLPLVVNSMVTSPFVALTTLFSVMTTFRLWSDNRAKVTSPDHFPMHIALTPTADSLCPAIL